MAVNVDWNWLKTSEYGGQDGSVLTKLFRGKENLTAEELLAREVIQNSWDAARVLQARHSGRHIAFRMVFRFVELRGQDKADFAQVVNLESLRRRRDLVPSGTILDDETALQDLDNPDSPLRLLYLEDYGSHGLHGDPEKLKRKSHLFKALYLVGGTGKTEEDAAQGGSFGFGKSAFVRASGTNTVIAHSAFEPQSDDLVTRRLVGWTWWPGHTIKDEDFEGRAIFGCNVAGHVVPYCDEEADAIASTLGIPARAPDDLENLGTTFLLVDPVVTPSDITEAIEKHWWPALEDHLMDVQVIDYDGAIQIPRPSKVPWLTPYIEAYRLASGVSEITDPTMQKRPSDRWQNLQGLGLPAGSLSLVTSEEAVPDELRGPRVALIRSPRMVIDYKPFLRRTVGIYGVFVASDEVDPLLRNTEPPAHDLWDTKDDNDVPLEAAKAARGIIERIRKAVIEFADEFQPPPPKDGQRLLLMASLLSQFMRNKSSPPATSQEPISIQFFRPEQAVHVSDTTIAVDAGIQVSLADAFEGDTLAIRISCPVVISEDESAHGEKWPALFQPEEELPDFVEESAGVWQGPLNKGAVLRFHLLSEPYDAEWSAIVHPKVEVLEIGRDR